MTRPPFRKVLVANRGEIALRVIRTLRALGIASVAVYSEADEESPHALEADEAVLIGKSEPRASYLSIDAILKAAVDTGAEAIHPGYGFLSENAGLAAACADAGLVFVGPPAAVLGASADKLVVKRRVAAAGVPVIPGPLEPVAAGEKALYAAARATGFPLLLKASAGGGGKGMRAVEKEADLLDAAEAARREAGGAFGNAGLYLERIVRPARHVEVQVLADAAGTVAVLGERDCSLQRRHQKVIEETPAPGLSDAVRSALHAAGARAAEAVGYQNAGTVEFLLRPDGSFFFLELNRRLQVEHPVTEAVLGIDLVAWQLRIAAGELLPDGVSWNPRGHAVEARIYAEDAEHGFLPSVGTLLALREPEGPGIRVDAALTPGLEISPFYDPLLAKVVAHGETRDEAIRRLDLALSETVVLGVRTNVGFLRRCLADDRFRRGELSTDLLDCAVGALCEATPPSAAVFLAAAAHELLPWDDVRPARGGWAGGEADLPTPWDTLGRFRVTGGRL